VGLAILPARTTESDPPLRRLPQHSRADWVSPIFGPVMRFTDPKGLVPWNQQFPETACVHEWSALLRSNWLMCKSQSGHRLSALDAGLLVDFAAHRFGHKGRVGLEHVSRYRVRWCRGSQRLTSAVHFRFRKPSPGRCSTKLPRSGPRTTLFLPGGASAKRTLAQHPKAGSATSTPVRCSYSLGRLAGR
jgi:hypothetical protein